MFGKLGIGHRLPALSAVSDYLAQIGRIPMLADDEPLILGRRIQRWQRYEGGPDAAPPGIKRSGLRARERFVTANLRLVLPLVRKYRRAYEERGGTMMDLIQEGNASLMRGVEKFDPELGYRPSTYLYWWIRQGISRATEVEGVVRISANSMQLDARVRKTLQQLGPGAKLADACTVLKLDVDKTTEVLSQIQAARCLSLDHCCSDDSSPLSDLIADPTQEVDYDQLDRALAIEALEAVAAPQLRLVELSLTTSQRELAVVAGCKPHQVKERVDAAKEELRGHLSRPAVSKPWQNVTQISSYRPPVTTSNGCAEVVALEAAIEAPAVEPVPVKARRRRRTKEEMQAARAEKQEANTVRLVINGVAIEAGVADVVQLLKHLAA